MQTNKNLAVAISAVLMILTIAAPIILVSAAVYYPPGTHVTTYAQINVAPNPVGIGQTVTINMYLAVPLETSETAKNMTLYITDPHGEKSTYGPFTSDTTGGTYYLFVPDTLGNYSIYWYYPGQTLTGNEAPRGWGGLIADPSTSPTITLMVQEEQVTLSAYPITPLPGTWWQTPVTAENIQEWYKICGPWLGFSPNDFASCGALGLSNGFENCVCNPYTSDVTSGHIIWTLPWGAGGVPGGIYGGTENSNYWMTRQYSPNFAAVIMNGVLYSQQYTFAKSTGALDGIVAIDLYTGKELFRINTTNNLIGGMMIYYKNPNQYGVVGPFLWTTGNLPAADTGGIDIATVYHTTGTQWNMYDAFSGNYIGSIVNGTGGGSFSAMQVGLDDQGGWMGYYINSTAGTQTVTPGTGDRTPKTVNNTGVHLDCFNFTQALISGRGFPQPSRNFVIDWNAGMQFAVPTATQINGKDIAGLNWGIESVYTYTDKKITVAMCAGFVHGNVGSGYEQAGFVTVSAMDGIDGSQLMLKNITTADTGVLQPWTRIGFNVADGKIFLWGTPNWKGCCYDLRTGNKLWGDITLKPVEGREIQPYNVFNFKSMYANGVELVFGFGGDMWGINATTGTQMWAQHTNNVLGDPGIETPYGIWPLWIFAAQCQSANVAYYGVGHEYDPPLFHGAQMIALNMTDGSPIFTVLGTYTRAFAIAQGVLISMNEYDNQVYAFAKGPTKVTVSAPSVGVTTATPITISGTVTDVSPGTEQDAVKLNYPNGVPAVSDESQSLFMETVYQQQPMPNNVTGVQINLYVLDSNGNYREIGTTISDAFGTFTYTWTPDIPGEYKLYACFDGSNSYWSSSASAGFYASEASGPTAPPQYPQPIDNTMTIVGMGIAVIIAIAIAVVLIIRKR